MRMICPNCVYSVERFVPDSNGGRAYECPQCGESVPARYVLEYDRYLPVPVSLVGLSGHGKTVYLSSLLHEFDRVGARWPGFSYTALDEEGLAILREKQQTLERGLLPVPTAKLFPRPVILQLEGVPVIGRCRLLIYDTGGEAFERTSELQEYAGYVLRSPAILWLVSLSNLSSPGALQEFLTVYMQGLMERNASPRRQLLLVVLTKGDLLASRSDVPPEIWRFLAAEELPGEGDYWQRLELLSRTIEGWLEARQGTRNFVRQARGLFAAVRYSVVSALGSAPDGQTQEVSLSPRGVLQPLIWRWRFMMPTVSLCKSEDEETLYFNLDEALAAAPAGATLRLSGGTHRLRIPLRVEQPLRLEGPGADRTRVTGPFPDALLEFAGDGALTLRGIHFEHAGPPAADVVRLVGGEVDVRQCAFSGGVADAAQGIGGCGLVVARGVRGRVLQCEARGNAGHGILVTDAARATLERNTCRDNGGEGLRVAAKATTDLNGNASYRNGGSGIAFADAAAGSARENDCRENAADGIAVAGEASPTLEGNTCRDNAGHGLAVEAGAKPALVRNTLQGNSKGAARDARPLARRLFTR